MYGILLPRSCHIQMNVIDKLTAFMRALTSDKTVSVVAKPMNCFL